MEPLLKALDAPAHLEAFLTSLAIGLLIGVERERRRSAKAGLRTFALVALLGTLAALLSQAAGSGWVLAAGLLAVGATLIVANLNQPDEEGDPGTTSVVALLVCYSLGATVWYGYGTLAVMLAIGTTLLLYFKAELHGISQRLTPKDLNSMLQFAVLSLVILPILPNAGFGPYGAFNPYHIWLMVVLISGVSLTGYAALRLAGTHLAAPVLGLLGGLVSSTATTVVFSRHVRQRADLARTAAAIVVLASVTVLARLLVLAAAVAPAMLWQLAQVFAGGLALGLGAALYLWRREAPRTALPAPEVGNPAEIRTALGFGALYALVLMCSAWLSDVGGAGGVYAVAVFSGLTDVDAITLSSLRLNAVGTLSPRQTAFSIAIAVVANLAFKSGLVVVLGGGALARRALPGLLAIAAGVAGGLLVL